MHSPAIIWLSLGLHLCCKLKEPWFTFSFMFVSPGEFVVYSCHRLNIELSGTLLEIITPVPIIYHIKKPKHLKKESVLYCGIYSTSVRIEKSCLGEIVVSSCITEVGQTNSENVWCENSSSLFSDKSYPFQNIFESYFYLINLFIKHYSYFYWLNRRFE